jgi:16S rRNA processing protein RimM
VVERDGEEILIPASEEMITNIDHEARIITFNLPEGLINI